MSEHDETQFGTITRLCNIQLNEMQENLKYNHGIIPIRNSFIFLRIRLCERKLTISKKSPQKNSFKH